LPEVDAALRYYRAELDQDVVVGLKLTESDFYFGGDPGISPLVPLDDPRCLELAERCEEGNRAAEAEGSAPPWKLYYVDFLLPATGRGDARTYFVPFYTELDSARAEGCGAEAEAGHPVAALHAGRDCVLGDGGVRVNDNHLAASPYGFPWADYTKKAEKLFGDHWNVPRTVSEHWEAVRKLCELLLERSFRDYGEAAAAMGAYGLEKTGRAPVSGRTGYLLAVDTREAKPSNAYNRGMLRLYDQILADETKSCLFRRYLEGSPLCDPLPKTLDEKAVDAEKDRTERYWRVGWKERIFEPFRQLGAFNASYALTPSQRFCLSATRSDLEVVPVSGPPGNGKTSLLRAFVADYTVQAAIHAAERLREAKRSGRALDPEELFPPLVAFSTNTQAVVNIVEGITGGFLETKEKGREFAPGGIPGAEAIQNPEAFFKRWFRLPTDKGGAETEVLYVPRMQASQESGTTVARLVGGLDAAAAEADRHTEDFLEAYRAAFGTACRDLNEAIWGLYDLILSGRRHIDGRARALDERRKRYCNEAARLSELAVRTGVGHRVDCEDGAAIFFRVRDAVARALERGAREKTDHESRLLAIEAEAKQRARGIAEKAEAARRAAMEEAEAEAAAIGRRYEPAIDALALEVEDLKRAVEAAREALKKKKEALDALFFLVRWFGARSLKKEIARRKKALAMIEKEAEERAEELADHERRCAKERSDVRALSRRRVEEIGAEEADALRASAEDAARMREAEAEEYEAALRREGFDRNAPVEAYEAVARDFAAMRFDGLDIDGALERSEEENARLDTTTRLALFYAALHLLEGVALLSLGHRASGAPACPLCGEDGVCIANGTYRHSCRDGRTFLMRTQVKIGQEKVEIDTKAAENLIRYGTADYAGRRLVLKTNADDKTVWHNVVDYGPGDTHRTTRYAMERLRLLTGTFPILVTTAQSFFGAFAVASEEGSLLLPKGYFRWVLVDEAGMMKPSLLAPLHAARRAFFFGDTKQIEQIYPFGGDRSVERGLARRECGGDEAAAGRLEARFSLFDNSGMDLANRAVFVEDATGTRRADENAPFWLLEHFRCPDSVIGFCNALMYEGIIEPKAGDESDYKHIVFVRHGGLAREDCNVSETEARIMSEIVARELEAGTAPADIGVITPYRNQKRKIEEELARRIGAEAAGAVTVGTVHAFQGSERRLVLFSTATGANMRKRTGDLFMNRDRGNRRSWSGTSRRNRTEPREIGAPRRSTKEA